MTSHFQKRDHREAFSLVTMIFVNLSLLFAQRPNDQILTREKKASIRAGALV